MNNKDFAVLLPMFSKWGGTRVKKVDGIQARKVRLAACLSQAEFARLIGVPVKTLQNWEQNRTRPAGTARALLKTWHR